MSGGTKPSEEQLQYASVLQTVSLGGLAILVAGFLVYVSGLLPSLVPPSQIPRYWSLRVHEYLEQTGAPTGWHWVANLHHGDVVSFLGIVLLAAATLVCFVAVLPTFLRKKDLPYTVIVVVQIGVLLLAASGLITGGGH